MNGPGTDQNPTKTPPIVGLFIPERPSLQPLVDEISRDFLFPTYTLENSPYQNLDRLLSIRDTGAPGKALANIVADCLKHDVMVLGWDQTANPENLVVVVKARAGISDDARGVWDESDGKVIGRAFSTFQSIEQLKGAHEEFNVDRVSVVLLEGGAYEHLNEQLVHPGKRTGTLPVAPSERTNRRNPEQTISQLFVDIVKNAVAEGASDIHLYPSDKGYNLEFRIENLLIAAPYELNVRVGHPLVNHAKQVGKFKHMDSSIMQSGVYVFKDTPENESLGLKGIRLRLETMPVTSNHDEYNTEALCIRIQRCDPEFYDLTKFYKDPQLSIIQKALSAREGLMLLTGPTSSGKTATLYACLNQLRAPRDRRIYTVEEPVEIRFDGISQTEVNEPKVKFSGALRSLLRMNPNVIMVGEIRDSETAQLAIRASNTGCKVLSTLHTNDAVGTISRLRDLGEKPSDIAQSLTICVAQRLVRVFNPKPTGLTEQYDAREELNRLIGGNASSPILHPVPMIRALDAKGILNEKAYKGRVAVSELWVPSGASRQLIAEGASSVQLKESAAKADGLVSLLIQGLTLALEGKTSLEKVCKEVAANENEFYEQRDAIVRLVETYRTRSSKAA